MTKEAKVGMLTGLGVIVLIGVLLSEYLGDQNMAQGNVATGQMAPLPVGQEYRSQVTSPVGVPAMAPAGPVVQLANGPQVAVPVTDDAALPPAMASAESTATPTGPAVSAPVAPVEVGPVLADSRRDSPPVISPRDSSIPMTLTQALRAATGATDTSKPAMMTHTVAAGDTLAKIAKKYYGSSKNSDIQRIVSANPTILKDSSSVLLVGKTLLVPAVGRSASAAPASPTMATATRTDTPVARTSGTLDNVVVYTPSSSMTDPSPAMGLVQSPASVTAARDAARAAPASGDAAKADSKAAGQAKKTYVVQSGDTLEKIARKLAPTKSSEMVRTLMTLNGIKDPTRLQVGATLKLPA